MIMVMLGSPIILSGDMQHGKQIMDWVCSSVPTSLVSFLVWTGASSNHFTRGDVALITSKDLSDAGAPWTLHSVWAGGHSGVVRSLYWDEEVQSMLGLPSLLN